MPAAVVWSYWGEDDHHGGVEHRSPDLGASTRRNAPEDGGGTYVVKVVVRWWPHGRAV